MFALEHVLNEVSKTVASQSYSLVTHDNVLVDVPLWKSYVFSDPVVLCNSDVIAFLSPAADVSVLIVSSILNCQFAIRH